MIIISSSASSTCRYVAKYIQGELLRIIIMFSETVGDRETVVIRECPKSKTSVVHLGFKMGEAAISGFSDFRASRFRQVK